MDGQQADRPGRLIGGRYRMIERIGVGGSAVVWRAVDARLDRVVALKLLHPHLLPDASSRQRLAREARAVAALDHPSIVRVHDVVLDGEEAAIVLELVDGESLQARVARTGSLQPAVAAALVLQLADALAVAHRMGVLHRDLTPANVLLLPDGQPKLVDFGIARMLQGRPDQVTAEGQAIGTMRWMAPEQLVGEGGGVAVDIHGLGALLHFMLSGRPPADWIIGPDGSLVRQLTAAAEQAPAPLSALAAQCLSDDPGGRPASAAEIAAFLRGWLSAQDGTAPVRLPPGPAASPAPDRGVIVPVPPDDPTIAVRGGGLVPEPSDGHSRRRRGMAGRAAVLVASLAIALLVAAPLFGWLGAGGGDVTPPPPGTSSPPPTPVPTPTPTPTPAPTPTPTPAPTPPPPGGRIVIIEPEDGATVRGEEVVVRGLAPPGTRVVRDIPLAPDPSTTADVDGRWVMRVRLEPGPNQLTFRVGDDVGTARTVLVVRR